MNIMPFRVLKKTLSTVILTCRSTLVPIYTSKVFIIVETEEAGLDNVTVRVKKKRKSICLHYEDSLLKYKTTILLIVNTLK